MYESLMEEVVQEEHLAAALAAVKRNQGAVGIDHMKTSELERPLQKHWPKIRGKLLAGMEMHGPGLSTGPGRADRNSAGKC